MEKPENAQSAEQADKTSSHAPDQTEAAATGAAPSTDGQHDQRSDRLADRPDGNGAPNSQEAKGETQEQTEQAEQAGQEQPDEMAVIQAQLTAKEEEAQANHDLLLRERAELENFKRRMQREKSDALRFATEPLLRDILPVIDNLERAIEHAKSSEGGQALVDGVELVLRSLINTIEQHGVSRVKAKGEPFDPSQHEAVAQVESETVTPNTVIDEHQSGYQLHNRLLRPAMVSVAKAVSQDQKNQQGQKDEEEKSES